MPYFKNLTDEKLIELVKKVVDTYKKGLNELNLKNFHNNIVDPFSALFEIKLGNIDDKTWIEAEQARQLQKSISNAYGEFHQEVLGAFTGWRSLPKTEGTGIDLEKSDKTIFAEVKNKHNTMNSGATKTVYEKLEKIANKFPDSKCYLVQIFNKRHGIYPFSNEGRTHNQIFIVDGRTFYDMVSGEENTLERLFIAITEILETLKCEISEIKDLNDILQNDMNSNDSSLTKYLFRKSVKDFDNKKK